jgi:hypothetical protein
MNTEEAQRLRDALREASEQFAPDLQWGDVIRHVPLIRARRWKLPMLAAVTVSVIVVATILLTNLQRSSNDKAATLPAASVPVTSSEPATAASATGTAGVASGAVLSAGLGFPPATNAPTTLRTSNDGSWSPDTIYVVWASGEETLLVTTFGSRSCPRRVESVVGTAPGSLTLVLTEPYAAARITPPSSEPSHFCTDDLTPYTSIVQPPQGYKSDRSLVVTIDSRTIFLPAR